MNFWAEVWASTRPYLVAFLSDFLVCLAFWLFFWVFHLITDLLAVRGWAGVVLVEIHQFGAILAFVTLCGLSLRDIFRISREAKPK